MVYVTHDQVEAMTMGDKIVVMRDGVIQQIGDPLTLYNKPVNRFVAGFMGSPPMNFFSVQVVEEGGKIFIDEGNFKLQIEGKNADAIKSYAGKSMMFGIRAEDLSHSDKAQEGKTITASVGVIEPLGAETHVFVNTKKHQMVARVEPSVQFTVGDDAHFLPNMSKAIFFDMETDQAVNLG